MLSLKYLAMMVALVLVAPVAALTVTDSTERSLAASTLPTTWVVAVADQPGQGFSHACIPLAIAGQSEAFETCAFGGGFQAANPDAAFCAAEGNPRGGLCYGESYLIPLPVAGTPADWIVIDRAAAAITAAETSVELQAILAEIAEAGRDFDNLAARLDQFDLRLSGVEAGQRALSDRLLRTEGHVDDLLRRVGALEGSPVTSDGTSTDEAPAIVTGSSAIIPWFIIWPVLIVAGLLALLFWWRRRHLPESDLADRVETLEGRIDDPNTGLARAHEKGDNALERVGDVTDRVQFLEESVGLLVERDAQDRFHCPDLTDDRLNSLRPGDEPIVLQVRCRDDVKRRVEISKSAGDPGALKFTGVHPNRQDIQPRKDKDRPFTVAQVWKMLARCDKADDFTKAIEDRRERAA